MSRIGTQLLTLQTLEVKQAQKDTQKMRHGPLDSSQDQSNALPNDK